MHEKKAILYVTRTCWGDIIHGRMETETEDGTEREYLDELMLEGYDDPIARFLEVRGYEGYEDTAEVTYVR